MTSITLPWPPSVNRYYRNVAGKTLISAEGRAYRAAVVNLLAEHRTAPPLAGAVAVDIEVHMPDRRRRDLDNLLKGLLDALTHAGLWLDDSQVDDLRIRRAPTIGGMVKVLVKPVEEAHFSAIARLETAPTKDAIVDAIQRGELRDATNADQD